MSENTEDGTVDKKKSKRGKRGGAKSKSTKSVKSLENEIIKLLRSEGFGIPSRAPQQSAQQNEKQSKGKAEPSEDIKLQDVRKIFKSILERLKIPEFDSINAKKKSKSVPLRTKNDENKSSKKGRASNEKQATDNKKDKFERSRKKNKKSTDVDAQHSFEKKSTALECESRRRKDEKFAKDSSFPKRICKRDILAVLSKQDTENPAYVTGRICINSKNSHNAYVNIDDETDILISGIRDRNRAMENDLVAVMVNPKDDWRIHESCQVQKTGTVVCILEKTHSRSVVGTLELWRGRPRLRSRDLRIPPVIIDVNSVPDEVKAQPGAYTKTLFVADIDAWPTPHDCRGSIKRIMGEVGDLKEETAMILLDNGLDVTPYDEKLTEGLPTPDYAPTASDLEGREDWRNECVFTIDPATAVDLDDAVSCKKLPNDNYEVGVHICDVTHYLEAFSPLDEEVSKRATTVYLVNAVYHMLPKSLYQVCSLRPGRDKLSFSVIWEMTPEAKIIKHRFAKSVVNSCYQMSYEEAQSMIDEPSRDWTDTQMPGLKGKFSANDLCETVNILYGLSTKMRERRFADGALSINQPKLQIILDVETQQPISYRLEERKESNRLIEEFMLLANMTVAKHLYDNVPDTALVRIHGKPLKRVLLRTTEDLGRLGVHLNPESAGSLQSSLSTYEKTGLSGFDQKFVTDCRMMVINVLCAQSMPRAKYVCCASIKNEQGLRHFALNVPFYTHFTSPIRRYADCIVHRLLFASLTSDTLPADWSAELCAKIASNCNGKKYSAKLAQEKSNELYFINLLSRNGPTEVTAIVMKVKQHGMDVILCHIGITVTVGLSDIQKNAEVQYSNEDSVPTIIVKWKRSGDVQIINVFSMINLVIAKNPKSYAIHGTLLSPRGNATTSDG